MYKLYSLSEAARELNVSRTFLYGLIDGGFIRTIDTGKTQRISEAELKRFTDPDSTTE